MLPYDLLWPISEDAKKTMTVMLQESTAVAVDQDQLASAVFQLAPDKLMALKNYATSLVKGSYANEVSDYALGVSAHENEPLAGRELNSCRDAVEIITRTSKKSMGFLKV